jgi:HTH-type transcriptional regulator/antitoxin HipB
MLMNPDPDQAHAMGDFVRQRREALGLTSVGLAELAGVGRRALSELEEGKPTLRLDVANRVLAVFGMQVGVVARPRPPVNP